MAYLCVDGFVVEASIRTFLSAFGSYSSSSQHSSDDDCEFGGVCRWGGWREGDVESNIPR